jgi:hypothetical protein
MRELLITRSKNPGTELKSALNKLRDTPFSV